MLTAIVVSVSTTGVALAVLLLIWRRHKTLEEDRDPEIDPMNAPHPLAAILIILIPLMSSYAIPILGWRWRGTACLDRPFGYRRFNGLLPGPSLHRIDPRDHPLPPGGWLPPWGIEYVIDPLNGFMGVLIGVLSFLITISSRASVEKELPDKKVRFYAIYLLLFTGLMGILVTGDAFNLYVFLEIASSPRMP